MKSVHLYPGDILCSSEPIRVTTILGSCVAVVLYDPTTQTSPDGTRDKESIGL